MLAYFGTRRLDDFDSLSVTSSNKGMKKLRFNVDGFNISTGHEKKNASKSFRHGMKKGSKGLVTIGRSLKTGVARAVFLEDLKVSEKMIFDPQHKSLLLWNRLLVMSCILSVSIDPLFFYLPVFNYQMTCLGMDTKLAAAITTMRTTLDVFYLIRIALQFRTAYVDHHHGFSDEIVVWKYLTNKKKGSEVLATKQALLIIVFSQYIPRFGRFFPLTSDLKKSAGSIAESALAGAAYYLLWYLLASHLSDKTGPTSQIAGAFWYLLAIERKGTCWREACRLSGKCNVDFLYCGNKLLTGYHDWRRISDKVLGNKCDVDKDDNSRFNYGIYFQAMSSDIVSSRKFVSKFFYCLWWGLQNLSTLGQGLQTSTYPLEVIFSILLAISGLILFALLIGNMQTYLQSLSVRLEEMRIKRRDSEQWMHHRLLPHDLRERVRKYDQYKWFETRGVDEENLVQNLPKDLRRDIKRHLCLNLVRRVPLFANMDERLLDAICERLKPSLYTEETYIVREGDPVDKMLFIIRGRLESVTTDGGRSGFFNRGVLKEGAFCGEELLTWALDPKSLGNLPLSTRTVGALTEVEAFALEAEELKFVASQFRRLHSRQVQHTFRFYSQQWRTWAACFIQTAWRRYSRRKAAEVRRLEEEEEEDVDYDEEDEDDGDDDDERALVGELDSAGLRATIVASRFAANALRGHKLRGSNSRGLKKLQKPPEPDFNEE
ncbi:cyclic nucleotide gated channel 7 family protein [Populus alba x Populus x berolinensis]|nr:cyclic nucleotide gated channel 7 family protein [Populus alba x Populus x berolinensis]